MIAFAQQTPASDETETSWLEQFQELIERCDDELVERCTGEKKAEILRVLREDIGEKEMDMSVEFQQKLRTLFIAANDEVIAMQKDIEDERGEEEKEMLEEEPSVRAEEWDAVNRTIDHQNRVMTMAKKFEKEIFTEAAEAKREADLAQAQTISSDLQKKLDGRDDSKDSDLPNLVNAA